MRRAAALSVLIAICGACSGSSSPTAPSRQITVSGGASGNAFGTIVGSDPLVTAQAVNLADCLRPSPAPACFSSLRVRPTSQTAKTVSALVAAPINLNASSSGSSVTLTWVASSGADAYIIEAGSAPGLANLANFSTGTAATSFQASGVGPGAYYVRVRALNGAGVSAPSNEVLLVVGSAPCVMPGAPSGLTTVSISGSTVVLSWTASAGSPTSYVVEAGSSSGLSNLANSDLGSAAPSLTTTAVGNGTYYVRVRAKNACGTSGPSNELIVTVGSTPTPTPTLNIAGQWDGIWLGNINISLVFANNSSGTATENNGNIFSHGTVTVTSLFDTNLVMKIHLSPDGNPDITRDYTVNATFLNNHTEMKGSTVSGTQDFDVIKTTTPTPTPTPTVNIAGQWDGIWLGNINISLVFANNSSGTATENNGNIFSHGTVTVTSLFDTNLVMKIHLSPDGNPDITRDYTVNATFLNNHTEMKGSTVSGTQDFDVVKK